jgi:quinol monooxygenase YgiN
MLAVFVTIKVKPGTEADFEKVAKELVAKVHANEPGCKLYELSRSDEPATFHFMERYVDHDAVTAHRATEYFKSLGRQMGQYMDDPPAIIRVTEV